MYRPTNYYAARKAAIKEALEECTVRTVSARRPSKMPEPESKNALLHCGERVSITLGSFFGALSGTVVNATYCYGVAPSMYIASFFDDDQTFHVVVVAEYMKRKDSYDYAMYEINQFD